MKRFEIFDQVCEKFCVTPAVLANQPVPELERMVKAIIGEEKQVNTGTIRQHAAEYAKAKQ